MDRTYTIIGGQRGGGKIFVLEQMLSMTSAKLKDTEQELERWKSAALYYAEKAATNNKWMPSSDVLPTEADADTHECVLVHTDNNENLIVHYEAVGKCREFIHFWMPLSDEPNGERRTDERKAD